MNRKSVLLDVQRKLWAESMGHCMNPQCNGNLFCDDETVADMAHIIPNSEGGNASYENLILLCPSCHRYIDTTRNEDTESRLKGWKKERNAKVRAEFTREYDSFNELKRAVEPLLRRNGKIFESYGPDSDDSFNSRRHELWEKFEGELIANNEKLGLILSRNVRLLHRENKAIVEQFVAHAREFAKTRGDTPIQRVELFPKDLLSIFGLEKTINLSLTSNLSALQNFVSHLMKEDRFVRLNLVSEQTLVYLESGKEITLDLRDCPNVRQIYFSGWHYHPKSTEVRLENLVFMLEWLDRNRICCEFEDIKELTELTLNGTHRVKLFYKYCLSLSDLHELNIEDGLMVVNVYAWNGAPISQDAYDYGSQVGIRLYSQNEFFVFVHKNLK